eukprot:150182-Pelagomonas_calceolata.AAC.1
MRGARTQQQTKSELCTQHNGRTLSHSQLIHLTISHAPAAQPCVQACGTHYNIHVILAHSTTRARTLPHSQLIHLTGTSSAPPSQSVGCRALKISRITLRVVWFAGKRWSSTPRAVLRTECGG